ncbi:ABC transporter permease [Streptosporangiaceae bacterium NEAU-GS5]|nr:ABC transporter permease [Streptosporangiaceae bacterium NEAU-GS5]
MNALLLVARREIVAQVRTRAFAIGLAVMVLLVGGATFAPKLFGGPDSYALGTVGTSALQIQDAKWTTYRDEASATKALKDGDVDAVIAGKKVLSNGELDPKLDALLQSANAQAQIKAAGLTITPLNVVSVGPGADAEHTRRGLAFIVVLVLFMLIISTPMMVAMGVVEEKGSRIVEILFTTVRPWQLLGGKILGLGAVGLINLAGVIAAGLVAATASGLAADLPPGLAGIVAGVVVWFILGYTFFAALAAALGSLVSRQEEVGNALAPMTTLIVVAYGVAFYALGDPGSTVARVVSLLPPFSAIVMPVRTAAADVALWEVAVSGVLLLAAVAGIVLLGARIYERAVLRTGARVRIGDVLKSS